jgi:hypothetical protein
VKVNSISGITCHVEDLARATEFYETIGFRRGKEEPDRVTFYGSSGSGIPMGTTSCSSRSRE